MNNIFYYLQHLEKKDSFNKLYYVATDSEKLFKENLQKMPDDWHYRTKEVYYQVNSDGYRTKEWKDIDWQNSAVIFGCSHIFGVGLAEDETISYQLEKMINMPVINMGYNGGSNYLMLMNCINMINNYGFPKAIIFNWTYIDRFLYYQQDNQFFNVGNWNNNDHINQLYNIYISNFNNIEKINYNLKLILGVFKNKTKIVDFSSISFVSKNFNSKYIHPIDRARDLMHIGHKTILKAAVYISQNI